MESIIDLKNFCEKLCSVCSYGWRLQLLTGFLVLWMQEHFVRADAIEDDKLDSKLWSPDIKENKVLIKSITKWKPQDTGLRPAIIVKRNSARVMRQIINDRHMPALGGPESTVTRCTSFIAGSHTLFCIADEGGECETFANEVYRELMQFAIILRPALGLHKLMVTEIGDLSLVEEATENYVVPITVAYAFEESWELMPQAPLLKRVDLAVFN